MKALALVLMITLCNISAASGQEEAPAPNLKPGMFSTFYAPTQPYRVTIGSENGLVSVLEVPKGVFLGLDAKVDQNPKHKSEHGLPRTFRGDLVIRTRRSDEMSESESRAADAIMAKSPLEIRLTGAVVLVEADT